jgi:polar amino acid transport system permease protein
LDPSKTSQTIDVPILGVGRKDPLSQRLANYPWWFVAIILIAIWTGFIIFTKESYSEAFNFIKIGIKITVFTSLTAFAIALIIGLITGMGRISNNVVAKNVATLYVEMIRGIPMLVLIFYIALVGVPNVVDMLNSLGEWISSKGLEVLSLPFLAIRNDNISMNARAVIALAVTYGAFLAEIFRAGIQSIGRGQMEAARSVGMSSGQAMRYIILPQAIRNVLPALGNDFVAMIKDSALVSVLAVRDITQVARLYAGRSFRFEEAYSTLAVMYLTITVILSLLVRYAERRMRKDEQ